MVDQHDRQQAERLRMHEQSGHAGTNSPDWL